jgi:hypothetical protein
MTEKNFDKIVENRISMIKQTLSIKGKEYRRNDNPLHNFERGATISNTSREKVLFGFMLKHFISFIDILNDIEKGTLPKEEVVDEKIGDLINYLILCEASIKDKIENNGN